MSATNAVFYDRFPVAFALYFFSITIAFSTYYSYKKSEYKISRIIFIVISCLLYWYLLFNGAYQNTGYLWSFAIAPVPYFLLGHKWGLIISVLWVVTDIIVLWVPEIAFYKADYPQALKSRYMVAFISLSILCYFQEQSRSKSDVMISTLTNRINHIARTDELTNIANRRGITETLSSRMLDLGRVFDNFGLLLIDIDLFKKVNDQYGHDVGDQTLIALTQKIQSVIRRSDFVGRWGGEEFVVVFLNINNDHLKVLSEKIRKEIKTIKIQNHESEISISVSIGATLVSKIDSIDVIIKRADNALYLSKENGRDQVSYK